MTPLKNHYHNKMIFISKRRKLRVREVTKLENGTS